MRLDPIYTRFVLLAGTMCLCAQDTVIRTTVPLILVPATVTDHRDTARFYPISVALRPAC